MLALSVALLVQGSQPGTVFPLAGPRPPVLTYAPCRPEPSDQTRLIFADCFYDGDYPLAAYRAREQGIVGVRVAIGPEGEATDCEVTASSGSAMLDRMTCDLLMLRIRYANAYDDAGRPVAVSLAGQVAWVLPSAPPHYSRPPHVTYFSTDDYPASALRARAEGLVSFTVEVNTEGRVTDCRIDTSSGSPALDVATCRIMRVRARYIPARDGQGVVVPGTDFGTIIWQLPAD